MKQFKHDIISCPFCGGVSVTTNNPHIRNVTDITINGYPINNLIMIDPLSHL